MANKLNSDSFDIKKALKEEGIYAYGFGHIAKAAMFDRDISCVAKGIYAYLCSFTNAKNIAYPSISTILNDLKIDKKTYYKHFEQLVENGYISVTKAENYKKKNVYIINEYVKKVTCELSVEDESESMLIVDSIKAHGYGTVPKLAMIDKRLTIKAKALMAFLLSLTGAGKRAFPRRDALCMKLGIAKNTYTGMMNELIKYGYIKVTQRRTRKGNFSINDYYFEINPVEIEEVTALEDSAADSSKDVEICEKESNITQEKKFSTCFNNVENGLDSEFSPCRKNSPLFENGLNSGFSPCRKNSPLLKKSRVAKIPPLPCRKNSPPNINNNNNPSMIGSSILYPTNKVINNNIPTGMELKEALHFISNYKYYSQYQDNYANKHCKIVDILVSIFSKSSISFRGTYIDSTELWKSFAHILENDYCSESPCIDFIYDVIIYYDQCLEMYHIEHPASYLRTIVIDKIVKDYENFILA